MSGEPTEAAPPRVPLDECGCCGSSGWEPAGEAQGLGLRRCTRCATVRFEAIDDPDAVYADGYHTGTHEFGWDYEKVVRGGYEAAMAGDRLELLERHVFRGSLLDVGGGLGAFVRAARERGWDAELLEPVEAAVTFARDEMGVPAHRGGVEALDEIDRSYRALTFLHSLEHMPAAHDALRAAARRIEPGGVVLVEVPNLGSMARRLQRHTWLGWQAGQHVYLFEKRTLVGLLERAGYEVLEARTWVPGWHGMYPDGYAHMVGLQPALWGGVRALQSARRAVRSALAGRGGGAARGSAEAGAGSEPQPDQAPPMPVPITEEPPLRRFAFSRGFDALAKAEEALGVGTNLQVVARPRAGGRGVS